jgi:formylglycine-generating enzyme required for sulfatase activity
LEYLFISQKDIEMNKSKILFITTLILFTIILVLLTNSTNSKIKPKDIIAESKIRAKDGMEMIYIPTGEFTMGSTLFESVVFENMKLHLFPDQRPQHKVYLDGYWIDKTEVTVGMFKKFVEETGYRTSAEKEGGGKPWHDGPKNEEWPIVLGIDWLHPRELNSEAEDNHPVVQVSWEDAMAYANWVGATLPTEAQWEKAARGVDERKFPWGDEFNGNYLNYGDSLCPVTRWRDLEFIDGYAFTSPVGIYPDGASPYGILDMAGNVWEWVLDWYGEDYYESSPYKNPQGPETGYAKSMRGGSWYDGEPVAWVTCVIRHQNPTNDRYEDVGFRCALNENNGK